MNEMEVVWGPDTYGMWPWSAGMETTRIDTNIWGPLVQDEQLVVQVHVQWSSCILFPSLLANRLFTFWRQPLSVQLPVWQAPDHTKLPLLLAYHRLEVINNKVYTIGGYSDKAPKGLGAGYRGEKKVWLDFTLTCPPQTISSPSTWPAFGSGGQRCPSCIPGCFITTVNFQSWCCSALRLAIPKMNSSGIPYWKLVALGGHGNSKLRSAEIYDPGSDLLLFRLDMGDLM